MTGPDDPEESQAAPEGGRPDPGHGAGHPAAQQPYPQQPYPQQPYPQQPYPQQPYPQQPYPQQPPMAGAAAYGPPPENHLVWAILSTVLCCLPLGIVSIVYSTRVESRWWQGLHQEAYDSADKAKKWAIASVVTFAVLGIAYVAVVIVLIAVGALAGDAG